MAGLKIPGVRSSMVSSSAHQAHAKRLATGLPGLRPAPGLDTQVSPTGPDAPKGIPNDNAPSSKGDL